MSTKNEIQQFAFKLNKNEVKSMIEYLQPLLLSDKITFVNENMCCPVCGSIHFKKNGHDENHVQRYFCNHCHASFSSKTNLFITAFPRSRMKKSYRQVEQPHNMPRYSKKRENKAFFLHDRNTLFKCILFHFFN